MKSRYCFCIALGLTISPAVASAQQWSGSTVTDVPQAGQEYMVLGGTTAPNSIGCYLPTGFCVNANGISLDQFANESDVNSRFSALTTGLDGTNAQVGALQSNLSALTALQNRSFGKVFDLVAISAALKDAIPNAGDRFALRVNAGGYQGHFAGAVGGSVNLNDQIRLSVNYGHGNSQQLFSSGLNFSFH